MAHVVISSALKVSLGKTARRCVPPVRTVITVILYTASAPTVTQAGSETGVRCAAPTALMVRTARTTVATATMACVILSLENASVTQAFMEHIAI